MNEEHSVPVIDLSILQPCSGNFDLLQSCAADEIIAKVHDALSNTGFLYLLGHGISKEVIEDAFAASKEFFMCEASIHHDYRRNSSSLLGFVDGKNEKDFIDRPDDIKKAYDFVVKSKEFQIIPEIIKDPLEELFKEFQKVSQFLLRLIALALGKNEDYLLQGHKHIGDINNNSSTMRTLYYPPVTKAPKKDQSRLSEHTDFGTFTMLLQDNCGGLEVLGNDGSFHGVTPIKNSIVLNIGDLLEIWSNFEFKSTMHRVKIPEKSKKRARQSMAFFSNPDDCYEIAHVDDNGNISLKSVADHIKMRNNTTIIDDMKTT